MALWKKGFIVLLLVMSTSVMAKKDSQYLLSEKTYKALSAAQELMAADKNAQAEKKLKVLLQRVKSGSYEEAVVLQTLGYLYSGQEAYQKAAKYFQKALALKALPKKVNQDLQYNLAQLYLADAQYKKGIALMEQWLKQVASPPNQVHILLASAYYRTKSYKNAIKHIRLAIKHDKQPKEAWYQLLLSSYLQLKYYKSAIQVLETLITRYPYQKTYWSQLSALYLQQNKEFRALAVKMLAERLNLNDNKTILSLAEMYRYLHIPYKAGILLDKAISTGKITASYDNLSKLADSWLAAQEKEKAATVLKKLVKIDKTGEATLKLGRLFFSMERWKPTIAALQEGLPKLKQDKQGEARLLLGMAYYHLGHYQQAKIQFDKALAYQQERQQAGQWLHHLQTIMEPKNVEQS